MEGPIPVERLQVRLGVDPELIIVAQSTAQVPPRRRGGAPEAGIPGAGGGDVRRDRRRAIDAGCGGCRRAVAESDGVGALLGTLPPGRKRQAFPARGAKQSTAEDS